MLISQALQKKRELKEMQFFGGDALNLGRWSTTLSVPNSGKHCWRIIITPDDPKYMLPFMAQTKPATATSYQTAEVEAVHRTDGKFEYLIIAENYDTVARTVRVTIEYSGKATFTITKI